MGPRGCYVLAGTIGRKPRTRGGVRVDEHPNGVAWINGDWCDAAEAALSILDCGVQPGLTVFDTAGVTAGRVFRLDAHLNRFYASLKVVRFDTFPHTREELERIVIETIRRS